MLQQAIDILKKENRTCVLLGEARVFKSDRRGVAPLLELLNSGADTAGCVAADRVVGKATAFLYCLLGVRQVHALVMSRPAAAVLEECGIVYRYDTLVDGIQNRQKDGPCPMEYATRSCTTPQQALDAIVETLRKLQAGS